MILTHAFRQEWLDQVGREATEEDVIEIMREGIRVVKGKALQNYNGEPYYTLSVYWETRRGVVIKFDEYRHAAVSVITAGRQETGDREQRTGDRGRSLEQRAWRENLRSIAARA